MIQYPSAVYPNKVGVINEFGVSTSFIFNGDRLYFAAMYVYDANTGQIVRPSDEPNTPSYFTREMSEQVIYNGDRVDFFIPSDRLQVGHSYTYMYILCQADGNGAALADLYIGKSNVTGASGTTGAFLIKSSMGSVIYPFSKMGTSGDRNPIIENEDYKTRIYANINNIDYLIRTYHEFNNGTGFVYTTAEEDEDIPVSVGTEYKLYSNYIVTPYYYFEYMSKPVVELTLQQGMGCINCSATYSQEQGVSIKYYNIEFENDDGSIHIVTDNIYSQHIEYNFPVEDINGTFTAKLHIVTQNDYSMDKVASEAFSDTQENTMIENYYCVPSVSGDYINIHWDYQEGSEPTGEHNTQQVVIYRLDVHSNKKNLIAVVDCVLSVGDDRYVINNYHDYTACSDTEYAYILVPISDEQTMIGVETNTISIHLNWWTITALSNDTMPVRMGSAFTIESEIALQSRSIGESWRLEIDLNDETLTQNLDKISHISTGKLPSVSAGKRNYLSGSLSGLLGWYNCLIRKWDDAPYILKQWREFISGNNEFLLKSPKGDVLIVSIIGNPTSEYNLASQITVEISFDWIETNDVTKYEIVDSALGTLIIPDAEG